MINSAEASLRFHYQCYETTEFSKAFRKLNKNAQEIVDKTIQDGLLLQPYKSKRLVSPKLKGKRSLRRGDYRIIFAVCEECRAMRLVHMNACKNCDTHNISDIILFVCGHRKRIYDA
jgi:mRNA-degrading endonuclease RelE of RelBE toxin-antitoxin system